MDHKQWPLTCGTQRETMECNYLQLHALIQEGGHGHGPSGRRRYRGTRRAGR